MRRCEQLWFGVVGLDSHQSELNAARPILHLQHVPTTSPCFMDVMKERRMISRLRMRRQVHYISPELYEP